MPCAAATPPAVYSTPAPSTGPERWKIDGSIEYDSEFADTIIDASARYDLVPHGIVLPYARLTLSYDTEPNEAGLSQVFTEDAVTPAAGLRVPFGAEQYGEVFAQGGYSFGLAGERSLAESRWGFDYSRDYSTSYASAFPHTQLNGEAIAYSRFAGNVIGSVDAYHDARITPWLRALLGAYVGFDSHREYGNNYAEVFAGFLIPFSPELNLQLSGVEGTYLSRGIDVPNPPWYSSFRVTLNHAYPP
jgi:hypothetical protein